MFKEYQAIISRNNEAFLTFGLFNNNNNNSIFNLFLDRIPPITGSFQAIDLTYMCGGTLLNRYTILTAAHCINTEFEWPVRGVTYTVKVTDPFDVNQYSVYLGKIYKYFFIKNTLAFLN